MSGLAKRVAALFLAPWAAAAELLSPCARAWAHARTASKIAGRLDPSVVILGVPEVHGTRQIHLGRDLYVYREVYLETRERGSIQIGDCCVISRGVHIVSFARIEIGAGTLIGEYSSLRDANHRIGMPGPLRDSGHDAAPIVIGRDVWIGRGVTILPGVTIGDRAVVGANAVVTHDVAPATLVAGVPARVLRRVDAA